MTAAAFFATGTLAAAPAFAAGMQPEMVPLPAIAVLPAMLILNTKKKENFKPASLTAKRRAPASRTHPG